MDATTTLSDRRQRASDLLSSIGHPATATYDALRALAAECLGLTASNRPDIAVNSDQLPAAAIIGEMTTDVEDDAIALHFDLTTAPDSKPISRVSNTQAQDANAAVQQHAGEPRTPLLIFTLPDDSGIQFIYGDPEPCTPTPTVQHPPADLPLGQTQSHHPVSSATNATASAACRAASTESGPPKQTDR